MNLTLGNTFPRTWKRFGVQHVALAAAAAIALSVVLAAGFTLSGDSGGGKSTGTIGTSGARISAPAAPNDTIYYVVGSQAEATRLQDAMAIAALEAGAAGYEWVSPERIVPVIIETPDQEMQLQAMLMELQQANSYTGDVRVIDLRR